MATFTSIPSDGINLRMGAAVLLNLTFVIVEGGFGFLSNSVASDRRRGP